MLGIGYAIRTFTGERAKQEILPVMGLIGVLIVLLLVAIWTIEVPVPAKIVDGEVITSGAEAAGVRGEQT